MFEFSLHAFTWTTRMDNKALDYLPKLKKMGYCGFEVPLAFQLLDLIDTEYINKKLYELEMQCVTGTVFPEEFSIISDDEEKWQLGINYLKKCIDLTADMGAKILSGMLYAPMGLRQRIPRTPIQWERSAKNLKKVARYAALKDITICMEPINRYESFFLNIIEDAILLVHEIDEPNVKINIDTYHMNIEEKNIYNIIVKANKLIGHVHCSENDRGIPGTGHFDWDGFAKGLIDIKYNGLICIESFFEPIAEIAEFTPIWRKLAPSVDKLAEDGIIFLKNKINQIESLD